MDLDWYYSWDCASGVIWNAKAISALTPAPHLAGLRQRVGD
jgi:hypothetical protein